MNPAFTSKVILITGASSGIGKALADEFLRRGASVVVGARRWRGGEGERGRHGDGERGRPGDLERGRLGEGETWRGGGKYLQVGMDVSYEEDCKRLIDTAVRHFGRIDVLINNAGISMRALFEETEPDVLKKLMDVNFWGTVYCTKYALPWLLKSGGSVAGISSVAGFTGLPGRTGYSASKFAMQGFLEALRVENLRKGLHVLIACPGFTASNIRNAALGKDGIAQKESPLDEAKLMPAEEVAKKIINAIGKRKRSVIMTGQGKMSFWIKKFFPGWLDLMVYQHMAKEADSPFK
jgi:dehydrogenase/reductase SDR family member 7B